MKIIYIIFLLAATAVFAQDYQKQWDRVVALEQKGTIKSARSVVDRIYRKAIREKNEPQVIKSFLYNAKYLKTLEEDAQVVILKNFAKETIAATVPGRAILMQAYAKSLESYLEMNYRRIGTRTRLDSAATNFLTWAPDDFLREIDRAYRLSLKDEAVLSRTPLKNYEAIFDYSREDEFLNYSVFDYLLGEYIKFKAKPLSRQFFNPGNISHLEKAMMGPWEAFVAVPLDSVKNADLRFVLELHQKREKYNHSAAHELQRLKFLHAHAIRSVPQYVAQLEERILTVKDSAVVQDLRLELANKYASSASKNAYPDYMIRARRILEKIPADNKSAHARAASQLASINQKSLSVRMSGIVYPGQHTRATINYRNTGRITVNYYAIDYKTRLGFQGPHVNHDSLRRAIVMGPAVRSVTVDLPEKKDHFEYTTEILLPQLPQGYYLAHFTGEDPGESEKPYALAFVQATNLAILARRLKDVDQFTIVDRRSGFPLKGVELKSENFTLDRKSVV